MTETPLPPPPALIEPSEALFLDFDGTLAPLTDRPEQARPSTALIELLKQLAAALDGRVAIVSGRDIATLRDFGLGFLTLAGSHGLEIETVERVIERPARHPSLDDIVARFSRFAAEHEGILVEEKPYSVGLHYRLEPELGTDVHTLAEDCATVDGLFVQNGKMLCEVRPDNGHKGAAIQRLLETAFSGLSPVFLGDDVTDEDGFKTCVEAGGYGVLVGDERPSAATFRLDGIDAVHAWLSQQIRGRKTG